MSHEEVNKAEKLVTDMTGWLFYLTSDASCDVNPRNAAQRRLAAAAEVFKQFTPEQKSYFLDGHNLNPAKLTTALLILVAFGLATLPEN